MATHDPIDMAAKQFSLDLSRATMTPQHKLAYGMYHKVLKTAHEEQWTKAKLRAAKRYCRWMLSAEQIDEPSIDQILGKHLLAIFAKGCALYGHKFDVEELNGAQVSGFIGRYKRSRRGLPTNHRNKLLAKDPNELSSAS